MRLQPQAGAYQPDPQILPLASWLGDVVTPADFPQTQLRFRNRRYDRTIGLDQLSNARWVEHFGHFSPLPDNIPQPLALRYHGHQFRVYNPQIGDGRGFLFAQMRDTEGRLLDCGTKGSGRTPWSRTADGRLTLKGAIREILASEMLEAQGVNTCKTLSVIETGEELIRHDEPSPARSAVLTRLSHGHIRIGTFQRLSTLEEYDHLAQLVDYCLACYPGPLPPHDAPGRDQPPVILMHQVVERLADLAASYMAAGFVHGVLNTDNMNISGESFDYGPWRWLPVWDPFFTAAYFDQEGLYAFGRQAEAISWNCAQLAIALRPLADAPPLVSALERFGPLYQAHLARRFLWRLGVQPQDDEADLAVVAAAEAMMREQHLAPDEVFFTHRSGHGLTGQLADALKKYQPISGKNDQHPYWSGDHPQSMLIREVDHIWQAIAQDDDWTLLERKISAVRNMGDALGNPPPAAGHVPLSKQPAG